MLEFWYLNTRKVDALYSQTTSRVEVEMEKTISTKNKGKFRLTLGGFLQFLGLPIGVDAELEKERAGSQKVLSVLSVEQKLTAIAKWIQKSTNLKKVIVTTAETSGISALAIGDICLFKCTCSYKVGDEVSILEANKNNLKVTIAFSHSNLLSQSYLMLLRRGKKRLIEGLAFVEHIEAGIQNEIELGPIAFGHGFFDLWKWN